MFYVQPYLVAQRVSIQNLQRGSVVVADCNSNVSRTVKRAVGVVVGSGDAHPKTAWSPYNYKDIVIKRITPYDSNTYDIYRYSAQFSSIADWSQGKSICVLAESSYEPVDADDRAHIEDPFIPTLADQARLLDALQGIRVK